MKRFLLYVVFMVLACGGTAAQNQDSVLAQMNAVKLDPDSIYGYGVMGDEVAACDEAFQELSMQVDAYISEQQFSFLRALDQCPSGTVHYLTCSKGTNYFRAIAYVSREALKAFEERCAEEYQIQGIGQAVEQLKDQIARAMTMDELEEALFNSSAAALITHGNVSHATEDKFIRDGFIVYYDAKTRRIVEVRTPCDENGIRKDARSGYPCEKTAPATPYLIYIDEPNK